MRKWVVGALVAAVVAAMASTASAKPSLTNISIQLQWVPQAQFAGYYAALDLGYYKAAGLNVKLLNGGPQIVPGQVVASGRAQFGVNWLTALLAARDTGTQPRRHRAGLQPLGHDGAHVEVLRHQLDREDEGQEGRELARRRPVRALRRADEERHGPGAQQGRHDRPAAVRHGPVHQPPGRRRLGDDLQRAGAGPRDEEPEDRQALPALRPERAEDAERRHGHARGQPLLDRVLSERARRTSRSPRR